jgi:GH24 family phage-related lysozyme (muramidase)/peptidoglycan hydrolase-like protein with peptidoglycan-binding domain
MVNIPDAAINLIKKFEGLHLEAYPDPASANGLPITIGYGSTRKQNGSPFQLGDTLTAQEAEDLLNWDLENRFLPPQEKIPTWATMTDNQRGAILSFAYNLGAAFFGHSNFQTITRVLTHSEWDQTEATFVLYRNPNSNVEAGLLKRRLAEAELFLKDLPGKYLSPAGQQYLSNILTTPQVYFASLTGPFEPGQRTLSLTKPFMRGEDIKALQQALIKHGYAVDADGVLGPMTKATIEQFQTDNKLTADGIVGPRTWATVLKDPAPVETAPPSPDPTQPGEPREPGNKADPSPTVPKPADPIAPIDIAEPPAAADETPAPEAPPEPVGPVTRLTLLQDTLLKLRPEEPSQLRDEEKQWVPAGTTYVLQTYACADPIAGGFNGHVKVTLRQDAIRGLYTWFVEGHHSQIEYDNNVVYPWEEQQATFEIKVYRDTVFKRAPMPSSALAAEQTYAVKKGTRLALHAYAYQDAQGDFSSHIKIAIKHQQDFLNGLSQWFVYDKHAYIEYDDSIVYPPTPLLRFTQDTIIKRRPGQSSDLPAAEQYRISAGKSFILDSWAHQDRQGRSFNRHIKFAIKLESDFIEKISTWYVYDQHAQVIWNNKVLYPPTAGQPLQLPGQTTPVYTQQPIFEGSDLTWGEATKNGTRIPPTVEMVNNIIAFAKLLQTARDLIRKPLVINSWYRDPAANELAGGTATSLHLQGQAVDLYVPDYSVRQVANILMATWPGGMLIFDSHLHLDNGEKRVVFL